MDGVEGSKPNCQPMISSTAIRRRLLAFTALSMLAGWANYESSKAIEYVVVNRAPGQPGGQVFDSLMDNGKALSVLTEASEFARRLLYANTHNATKSLKKILLCVDGSSAVAESKENTIHLSSKYIEEYVGDVEKEIRGFIYGEMGRLWLWDAGGQAPRGLLHGLAEYVRLRAGFPSSELLKSSDGNGGGVAPQDAWDGGGRITALFVGYCESRRAGFVRELNGRMEKGWDERVFEDLLGTNVSQIWQSFSGSLSFGNLTSVTAASATQEALL